MPVINQIHTALSGMEGVSFRCRRCPAGTNIFMEPELFQTGLCLVPGVHGNFQEKLSRLLQYIPEKDKP